MNDRVYIPIGKHRQVSGILSLPRTSGEKTGTGVILAHGAGNDMNHPLLVTLAQGLAQAGYLSLRFNFPYREQGRKSPDRQEVLAATWQQVYHFLRDHRHAPRTIIAAGKSMGGRVAAQMVAEGLLPVARLIFYGYPLHPPGRKEKLRAAHLEHITIPMLFFAGSRDSLCDLPLLQQVLERLSAPWVLEIIEGGDHSFRLPKAAGVSQQAVHERIMLKTLHWLGGSREGSC
ncbi:MAG: dienelactone hydrolase family protein [Deltaproteobacteria bacterium]|nr:dienelactone hydrolase family protein [Deltaproteobacteria bacterium]MBW2069677.1 dienelactone hydrolase family protein [Deltaproteobacteria bacterium]